MTYKEKTEDVRLVLSKVASMMLELDSMNEEGLCDSYNMDLGEESVMDATLIFASVINGYYLRKGLKNKESIPFMEETSLNFAHKLSDIIKAYTGIDTKTFYHK